MGSQAYSATPHFLTVNAVLGGVSLTEENRREKMVEARNSIADRARAI